MAIWSRGHFQVIECEENNQATHADYERWMTYSLLGFGEAWYNLIKLQIFSVLLNLRAKCRIAKDSVEKALNVHTPMMEL
jgi:hypothetical protein